MWRLGPDTWVSVQNVIGACMFDGLSHLHSEFYGFGGRIRCHKSNREASNCPPLVLHHHSLPLSRFKSNGVSWPDSYLLDCERKPMFISGCPHHTLREVMMAFLYNNVSLLQPQSGSVQDLNLLKERRGSCICWTSRHGKFSPWYQKHSAWAKSLMGHRLPPQLLNLQMSL